ncbi:hypothetical protein Bca101_074589 [Brassica carinata]
MFLNLQVFPDLRDFERLLRRLSEDSQKTLGRLFRSLLRNSSNAFYARRLPTKSPGNLPKSSAQSGINFVYVFYFSDLGQILEDFWDNSWKTLGRLSKDSRKTSWEIF